MSMKEDNLKERLGYFEERLAEAKSKLAAREPHPRTFDAGYSTEIFKTWAESIAVIKERIARIEDQLSAEKLSSLSEHSSAK